MDILYVIDLDNQVRLATSQNLRTFWDHIASKTPEDHNQNEDQLPPCSQLALMAHLKGLIIAHLEKHLILYSFSGANPTNTPCQCVLEESCNKPYRWPWLGQTR